MATLDKPQFFGPPLKAILWTCSRNLAHDLAAWMSMAERPLGDWGKIPAGPCSGAPKSLPPDVDRHSPEETWPKCDVCGETMAPFEAIYDE